MPFCFECKYKEKSERRNPKGEIRKEKSGRRNPKGARHESHPAYLIGSKYSTDLLGNDPTCPQADDVSADGG